MAGVGDLVTRLIMDSTNFDSTINRSQREINAFRVRAESVGRGVNSVFNGMAGAALKLVPVIAAGTTALGAFNKIINNSGSLADSLDKVMLQVGSSIDYVASRAADLNFDNAISGLRESVRLASDLADILDEISTIKKYKGLQNATTERLREEEKNKLAKWEQDPSEKNRKALEEVRKKRKESEAKDLKLLNKHKKELDNQINNEADITVNALGVKNLVNGREYVKEIARNKSALEQGQRWAAGFAKKNYEYPYKSGINILKSFSFREVWESTVSDRFEKLFKRITGLDFNEKNYNKVRAYSLLPEKEGVSDNGESKYITKITELYQQREEEEKAYFAGLNQSERINKRENKEIHTNSKKVNTKLTNTNETLEEINKKFEDAKSILLMQKNEGYLSDESYLRELLRITNNYIEKLYDPLYKNSEGIEDLRISLINAAKETTKQLNNLNKSRGESKLGNIDFNLINSNLYRQLEKLIYSQKGFSYGTEDKALRADWSRNSLGKSLINTRDSNYDKIGELLEMIESINRSISLNYGKVLTTILENDINILGEKASSVFERAFGGISEALTSSEVYDFLNAVRIMTSLPEEMAKKFREEWIRVNNNQNEIVSKSSINKSFIPSIEAFKELQKSDPSALNFVDPTYRPIRDIQRVREEAAIINGRRNLIERHKKTYKELKKTSFDIDKKDFNDYFKQNAPVQTIDDLSTRLKAFKDYNRLNDLDFFNNLDGQLVNIDKSLQDRIKALTQRLLNLIDLKENFEDQLNIGKVKEVGVDGKEVERDLTEDEIAKVKKDLDTINDVTNVYGDYIRQLESSQLATQKLIQISQVFGIKQKEIKEKFNGFRDVSSSIGEITSAFEALDNRVGDFAKTLGALNNFANIIANLVEKLELLKEAQKATKIAAEATGAAINGETTATTTNTVATTANTTAKTTSATANNTSATSTTTDTTAKTANTAATAANTAVTATDTAVSTAKTAANVGEAASEGTKQASKLPFPANIGAIAAVLAAVGGAAATISSLSRKKYATGGIVTGPGSSFSDSIPISVSNGEMILNKSQQRNLFDLLNYGGGSSRGSRISDVNFKILGENLVGSINNRNRGRNKIL